MREIKFRAWSKKTKKIYKDVIHINLNSSEGIWTTVLRNDPFEGKTVHYSIQPEHCELMQFTGLKDKNGVDIYEGDLLNFGLNNKNEAVVFYKGSFSIFNEPIGWDFDQSDGFQLYDFRHCEIIGNIYQNPELLNK